MKIMDIPKAFLDVFGGYAQQQSSSSTGLLAQILPNRGSTFIPRSSTEMLKFYSQSPLLRMVGGRIASDISAQNWRVYAPQSSSKSDLRYSRAVKSMSRTARHQETFSAVQKGDLREIDVHPLKTLLTAGNEFMVGLTIRKLTQLHLDLVGEAFWLLIRNLAGAPVEVLVIPPSWVESTPEDGKDYFNVKHRALEIQVPRAEMVWFVDPDPQNPYSRGLGTAEVLADELEIEEYAAKHVKMFFQNRAMPELLIAGPGLKRENSTRLEQRWMEKLQGFRKSYLPFFMNAPDGMQLHTMSQDFESMKLIELRKHERDIVMQTFGVSPEVFGVVENSNRATIDSADFLIAKHVLTPRLEVIREFLQQRLMPQYGDETLIVDYDSPIDEDREFQMKAAKVAPYTRSVNEWRDLQNLERIEGGDVYVSPNNVTAFETPDQIEAANGGTEDPVRALESNLSQLE
jgi:phage portal protein BeeE